MPPEPADQVPDQVIKGNISAPEGWKNVSSVEFNKDALGKSEFQNLLRAIHSGLYSTTFPLPEEQEDVEAWINRSQQDGRNPQQFINAHFKDSDDAPSLGLENAIKLANKIAECKKLGNKEDLKDLQKQFDALTVGFIVGEYYANGKQEEDQNQSAALFNYVIRNKDFSGGEYPAHAMIDQQALQYQAAAEAASNKLTFIGWEANDPRKTPFFNERDEPNFTVDVMDPERRIEILEKVYGAKKTNFQWIQPPLEGDKAICDALYLYSYPIKDPDGTINDKNPTEEQKINGLKHFVNQFYENFPVKDKFKSETNEQGEVKSAAEKFAEFYKEGAQKIKIPKVQENFASKTTISFKIGDRSTKSLPIADLIEEKLLPITRETFLKLKTIGNQTDSTIRTELTSTLRNGGI